MYTHWKTDAMQCSYKLRKYAPPHSRDFIGQLALNARRLSISDCMLEMKILLVVVGMLWMEHILLEVDVNRMEIKGPYLPYYHPHHACPVTIWQQSPECFFRGPNVCIPGRQKWPMEDLFSYDQILFIQYQYIKERKRLVYVKFMALDKYLTTLFIVPVYASLFPSGAVESSVQ